MMALNEDNNDDNSDDENDCEDDKGPALKVMLTMFARGEDGIEDNNDNNTNSDDDNENVDNVCTSSHLCCFLLQSQQKPPLSI